MAVQKFSQTHTHWAQYLEHTDKHDMTRWITDEQRNALPDVHYLGYLLDGSVVGHLALKEQPLIVPQTEWSRGLEHTVTSENNETLTELYVLTFAVDEEFRRHGYGSTLQRAGLTLGRERRAYQMRSWSSLDKDANFDLKLKLGFAVHPCTCFGPSGEEISGVYFIATIRP